MFSKETIDEILHAMETYHSMAHQLIAKLLLETDQPEIEAIAEGNYDEIRNADTFIHEETLSDGWHFDVHGEHCRFTHASTGQIVEVSIITKESVGNLDPYFFYEFLNSTDKLRHLSSNFERPFQDMLAFFEGLEKKGILIHVRGVEYKLLPILHK